MICLKSPKSSEFAIFLTNTYSGQKSLTMFISSYCNNYLIEFLKIRKIKQIKSYASDGIRTSNPWV